MSAKRPPPPPSPDDDAADAPSGGMWRRMTSLFRRTEDAAPQVAPPESMERDDDHWVPLTLDSLLKAQPDAELHLVTLTQFRVAIGPTWGRIRDKVLILSETVLRRFAGPGNLVQRQGEDVFLLAFPRLGAAEARKRAFAAAVDLGQRLVGARFSVVGDGEAPMLGFASGSGADLLGEDGKLDPAALAALAAAAQVVDTGSTTGAPATGRQTTGKGIAAKDEGRAAPDDPNWRRLQRDGVPDKADVRLVPIEPPKRKKAPEPEWVPIRKD